MSLHCHPGGSQEAAKLLPACFFVFSLTCNCNCKELKEFLLSLPYNIGVGVCFLFFELKFRNAIFSSQILFCHLTFLFLFIDWFISKGASQQNAMAVFGFEGAFDFAGALHTFWWIRIKYLVFHIILIKTKTICLFNLLI